MSNSVTQLDNYDSKATLLVPREPNILFFDCPVKKGKDSPFAAFQLQPFVCVMGGDELRYFFSAYMLSRKACFKFKNTECTINSLFLYCVMF